MNHWNISGIRLDTLFRSVQKSHLLIYIPSDLPNMEWLLLPKLFLNETVQMIAILPNNYLFAYWKTNRQTHNLRDTAGKATERIWILFFSITLK